MAIAASASLPMSALCSTRQGSRATKNGNNHPRQGGAVGNFGHFVQVVRKDVEFLKTRISKGIDWANEALHIPQLSKTLDDVVWLRNLEDPHAPPFQLPSWPHPYYPELSGVDLFVADLKALEAYVSYFYYRSKMLTKPLPEIYDPQEVDDYFSCRPHVVGFRLLEVSHFIYNHGWVLALMRKHANRELLRPATTRFATSYLTLQSMYGLRQPLEAMFTSKEWANCSWAHKAEGKEVKKIILRDQTFWNSVAYAIKTTKPLVSVLRMTDSEKMPGMGFIYGAMDNAKEEIASNLGNEEGAYKEIWSIIDDKWEFQLHRHLHAAAYFLNPHFQYDDNFSTHPEIKLGLYTCMDKLIPDPVERERADLQVDAFRRREGLFGFAQAKATCKKRSPAAWWSAFGDEAPELTAFAIKILSLTCSSSACERNWSTFNQVFASFASAAIRIRTSGIRKLYRSSLDEEAVRNVSQYNFGMVLKETMLNLGPTFIKVGQSLSTRPDIIGSEITKALTELHDQIPPFPRTLAMKIIEEELGSPVERFFSYISEEPVAAASFGQVYRGTTLEGFNVAVKVQRPNLRHVVVRDIYILRVALGLLQKIAKRKNDLRHYADELGKGLVGELDYTLEAANALEFKEAHSPFPFICVPKVLRHLSRKRVLTMEWMVGENPSDLISISSKDSIDHGSQYSERQQSDAKRRLLDLVSKGVEASLVQLLETGLLHADPHPGNLRYTSSGQIGFLDFGLLCRMEKKHQFAMLASIVHIVNGDWASLVHALTEMDVSRPGTNIRRVTMDLEDALGELEFKDGIPDVKFSRVLGTIWSVALKYHFRMPSYYTLVLRSLASLEGLAVAGDPNFKTFEAAYPYVVRKLLTDNSAATRKILQSVMLDRKKEFQWQKLALFLRVGATRKGLHTMVASNSETSLDHSPNESTSVFDVTNLVLRLVLSKDGVALRRLLMTADGASLIRAMISKEAISFRQQLCSLIADALHQSACEAFGTGFPITRYNSQVRLANGADSSSRLSKAILDYRSILRDRRLKVIFLKVLDSARKDPILMMRFCWASFIMFVTASALACHRVLVSLSEAYLGPVSFTPKRFAMST